MPNDRREYMVFHYASDGTVDSYHSPLLTSQYLSCLLCSNESRQTTIGTCRNCGVTIYRLSESDLWKHGDAESGSTWCTVGHASPWPDDYERFCSIERETSHTVKTLPDGLCPLCRKPRRLLKGDGSE
jgi:hypothetical protein